MSWIIQTIVWVLWPISVVLVQDSGEKSGHIVPCFNTFFQYLDEHPPKDENTHEAKTGLHDSKMDLLRATGDDAKKLGKNLTRHFTTFDNNRFTDYYSLFSYDSFFRCSFGFIHSFGKTSLCSGFARRCLELLRESSAGDPGRKASSAQKPQGNYIIICSSSLHILSICQKSH